MKVDDNYVGLTEPGNDDVKADDERPNIDEGLLILTDEKVNEDADATEKSLEKASKNIGKVILPMLKFHATNCYHMIDKTLNWKQPFFCHP